MVIFDTNVFIYIAQGKVSSDDLPDEPIGFASITRIEALGFGAITVAEQSFLEALLNECQQIDLDESVLARATSLRQQSKISLGDSIVATTALEYGSALWTANVADFDHIEGLRIRNPLAQN